MDLIGDRYMVLVAIAVEIIRCTLLVTISSGFFEDLKGIVFAVLRH